MKLHDVNAPHAIRGYGDGYVMVDGARHTGSVVIVPGAPAVRWPYDRFDDLDAGAFAIASALEAEVVLFGSGSRLRFPHPRLLAPLTSRGIGVETMDLPAACRTYNFLVAEGRRVTALLLIEAAA